MSFTYQAHDGIAFSNVATVTITVTPVADDVFVDYDAIQRLVRIIGTDEADVVELLASPAGQVQVYSTAADGQRVLLPIFDARTGAMLDPRGQGYPTVTSTRQVHALLGGGDDMFVGTGALIKGLNFHGEAGRDTVILRATDQADVIQVTSAEVIDAQTAGGNDRVTLNFLESSLSGVDWQVLAGLGNDNVQLNFHDATVSADGLKTLVDGGAGNDAIALNFRWEVQSDAAVDVRLVGGARCRHGRGPQSCRPGRRVHVHARRRGGQRCAQLPLPGRRRGRRLPGRTSSAAPAMTGRSATSSMRPATARLACSTTSAPATTASTPSCNCPPAPTCRKT